MNQRGPSMEELFEMLNRQGPFATGSQESEEPKQAKRKGEMWRGIIYQGNDLVLDHSQSSYERVFRFIIGALVELHNNRVQDFRVTIQNEKNELYFFAIGEKTQVANFKKA